MSQIRIYTLGLLFFSALIIVCNFWACSITAIAVNPTDNYNSLKEFDGTQSAILTPTPIEKRSYTFWEYFVIIFWITFLLLACLCNCFSCCVLNIEPRSSSPCLKTGIFIFIYLLMNFTKQSVSCGSSSFSSKGSDCSRVTSDVGSSRFETQSTPSTSVFNIIVLVYLCIACTIGLLFCFYFIILPICAKWFKKPKRENAAHPPHPDGLTDFEISTCQLPTFEITSFDCSTKNNNKPANAKEVVVSACPKVVVDLEQSGLI